MQEAIKFLRWVSTVLVWFSILWAIEDGCLANVLVAIIATAVLAIMLSLEKWR